MISRSIMEFGFGLVLICLFAVCTLAAPLLLLVFARRAWRSSRRVLAAAVGALALLVFACMGGGLASILPGGSGIVAELALPDGAQFMVAQKANYSLEPYTVSFFYKEPGAPWGYCYLDHEDTRWWSGKLVHDPNKNRVLVYRGAAEVASLDRENSSFTLHRWNRTLPAPQSLVEFEPSDWQ